MLPLTPSSTLTERVSEASGRYPDVQQDKSLVTVLLDQMIEKYGEGVRLIKVWRGPNYNSPFDRREVGWQEYEAAGKIVTVGECSLQDSVDSANIDSCISAGREQGRCGRRYCIL